VALALFVLVALAAAVLVLTLWSGVSLSTDPTALARVSTQPFAGKVEQVRAVDGSGRAVPVELSGDRLEPLAPIRAGEVVYVTVVVRRPSWLGWALGRERTEALTISAPTATVASRWLTVAHGAAVRVAFDQPVTAVAYGPPGHLVRQSLAGPQRTITVLTTAATGQIEVAAAVRSWEQLSAPVKVSWFPPSASGVLVTSPAPGSQLGPAQSIRLTLSRPVSAVFGRALPALSPSAGGTWRELDSHTLLFTPSGLGEPFDSTVAVALPRSLLVAAGSGNSFSSADQVSWSTPTPSVLRLQQLLAEQGYLPVSWAPSGPPVARGARAQLAAAVTAPAGSFRPRYSGTPATLAALLHPGQANILIKGAVMTFEHNNGLAVDGLAGPHVWRALLTNALAGRRYAAPYSYVFVHTELPQKLELWSGGRIILTSPGNTGIPSRPTQAGTFAVFEHIPVGTMSGTNPDGTHYHDPGIRWISYFNGSDAVHAFPRGSYGTPQSLGCVELPLDAAARVWPYMPIGTLVTIENSPITPS
jgi:hypothetical protein